MLGYSVAMQTYQAFASVLNVLPDITTKQGPTLAKYPSIC